MSKISWGETWWSGKALLWAGAACLSIAMALAISCGRGETPLPTPPEISPPITTPTVTPTSVATPEPTPSPTPTPTATPSPSPTPSPTATPTPTPTPTPTSTPTPTPLPTPALLPQPQKLFLEVTSPSAESIAEQPKIEVTGRSSPDATVSVNGSLTVRGPEGEFSLPVALDTGPNLLEIIATDLSGQQEEAVRIIIYVP